MEEEVVPKRLVWLDLEMTGLEVDQHVIVEIAALVTDEDLVPLDAGIDIVVHQPPELMALMPEVVRDMHTKSGLLTEIEASTIDLESAGAQVLEYVRSHVPQAGQTPLCGNSIGVDRRFLNVYLPELDDYLHYRNIDVSSLKELCRRWQPEIYRGRPDKHGTHRALEDVHASIAELVYYRDNLLIAPPAKPSDDQP